jgi:hypothetical protein
MKKIYTLVFLCLSYFSGIAQNVLLTEHFNYPADSLLRSYGWYGHSAPTTNPIRVSNGGLSWTTTPYLGSGIGNAAAVNNTGSDENKPFSTSVNSGNVYASFLMRVNGPVTTSNAGYFFHLGEYTNTTTPAFDSVSSAFRARTFVAPGPSAAQYKLGLAFNSSTVTTDVTALNLDTGITYLVVVKYQIVAGALNDSVSLYVFADGSNIATEPATPAIGPLAATVVGGILAPDLSFVQLVALRQFNATQRITIDGIVVKTNWSLLPIPNQSSLPITWDNSAINYVFADFGGTVSTLVPDPTNAANTTLRTVKTSGAQTWAGTTITPGSGLTTAIPFAAGATTLSVKVNAPAANVVVRLKAEKAGTPTISVETEATTTAAGWQTLVFNFANQAAGTAAINFANTYDMLSIFYGFGSAGTGATFYADSVFFGGSTGGGPAPVTVNLPITWDNPALTYTFTDFGGNSSALAPSPTDSTNTTLRTTKTVGAQTWAGTTITPTGGLNPAIPFASGATAISAKIYAPAANIIVRLKTENAANSGIFVETEDTTTAAGWQTLVFNFANQVPGTPAINFANTYNMLSIFYNFGTAGNGAIFFADSIFFGGATGGGGGPVPTQVNLPITWDNSAITYSFTDFGGNVSALAGAPNDTTNITLRSTKTAGAQTWAGTTITPTTGIIPAIPFATGATRISAKVFAPAAGIPVRMKAETAGTPTISVETEATTFRAGWQTLLFNFSNQATGTAALNLANTYNMLSVFYNFGTAGNGSIFYLDSVFFGGTANACPITTTPTATGGIACGPNGAVLSATPGDSTAFVVWSDSSNTIVGTGSPYTTSPLTANYNFKAHDAKISSGNFSPGPPTSINTGGFGNFSNGQYFTAIAPFYWDSVTFRANGAASGVIRVWDSNPTNFPNAKLIQSKNFSVSGAGDIQVPVDMAFSPGSYYVNIGLNAGSGLLWRSTGGAVYPYTVPGVMSIDSAWLGLNSPGNLNRVYYFLNWKVSEMCFGTGVNALATYAPSSVTTLPYAETFATGLACDWTRTQNTGSTGWKTGNAATLSSTYYVIPANGNFVASNDDTCNCNMGNDRLITPAFNFGSFGALNNLEMTFDYFLPGNYGSRGTVLASTDGGVTYNLIDSLPSTSLTAWGTRTVNLNSLAGQTNVRFAFRHNDGGQWADGFALDDVNITTTCTGTEVTVEVITDIFGTETTWSLRDATTNAIYATGGPYPDINPYNVAAATHVAVVCVPDSANVIFRINDSYGDGLFDGTNTGTFDVSIDCGGTQTTLFDGGGAFPYGGGAANVVSWDSLNFQVVCPPAIPQVSVTFQVDMSRETVSPNGIHIAGNFQGWSPSATPMVSQGNGIYTYTTLLDRDSTYQYKFINGNQWGTGFDEAVPAACAQNNNRFVVVDTSAITTPLVCFGRCEACGVNVFEAGSLGSAIRMYPNPTNAETHIAYEFQTPSDLNVTVYDARGKMVSQIIEKDITTGTIKLNVQNWSEGIYHVRMFNGSEQISRQLVVTK